MSKEPREKSGVASLTIGSTGYVMSSFVIANLTFYLTNSAAMAAGTVGTIFLASRLLDGVSDIIGGFIIDHTHTRWGKARPFDLVCIPLWICVVLCFSVPNLSNVGKIIWVLLTYNLTQSVCYTLIGGANAIRLKRSIKEKYRTSAVSITAIANTLISVVINTAMPILIGKFGDRPHGWTIISGIFAVVGIAMTMFMFFTLKELPEEELGEGAAVQASASRLSFVDSVKVLLKNRYVFIATAAFLLFSIIVNFSSVQNYYFTYIVGDIAKAAPVGMVSVLGVALVAFLPALQKKFGSKMTAMIGFGVFIFGFLARLVMPVSVAWLSICAIFATGGQVLVGGTRVLINIDCMTYGQRTSGEDIDGLYSAINGFSEKVGMGLGSWILGFIMDLTGFDGTLASQGSAALTSIRMLYTVIPAVVAILAMVILYFYNEKKVRGVQG